MASYAAGGKRYKQQTLRYTLTLTRVGERPRMKADRTGPQFLRPPRRRDHRRGKSGRI